MKIAISINSSWNFINFRLGLIKTLLNEGYEIIAIAPFDSASEKLQALGCTFIPIDMSPRGKNPLKELLIIYNYWKILNTIKPNYLLTFTVKPNIYGSIAARILRIPTINNIAGLGEPFARSGVLMVLVTQLYKIALGGATKIFFQNSEDRDIFIARKIVPIALIDRLPGSGINTIEFTPAEEGQNYCKQDKKIFLFASRLLWDKGIYEFIKAAIAVKKDYPYIEFHVVGPIPDSPNQGPNIEKLQEWDRCGAISYLGTSDDIKLHLKSATCLVLPSYYREGVPRILLEAAAMELPIITCNSIGCRDAVDDGITGFLCNTRDEEDLARKIKNIIHLSCNDIKEMGRKARMKMQNEFDEKIVIKKYLDVIQRRA